MVSVTLPSDLVQRLEEIARRENRPVAEVLASMVEHYKPKPPSQEEADAAFKAIFVFYDDDITDISTTVPETLHEYFQEKCGYPD